MIRLTRGLPVVLLCAALSTLGVWPASAQDGGRLRLAHLSPDTPAVDVYVDSVSHSSDAVMLPSVGYGTVSDYRDVAPGTYTVSMRAAGAAASTPPVLSTIVDVQPGSAHTVAGLGPFAALGLRVLDDDLTLPPAGQARVRVIASASTAPALDVSLAGMTAATSLPFGQASTYVLVPAGTTTLQVTPAGGTPAALPVDVGAGSVYTVLVLDRAGGGLQVQPKLDAGGMSVVPVGGVETGAGGTAAVMRNPGTAPAALGIAAAAVTALLLSFRGRLPRRGARARHAARS
jgi:hypothetical protein